MNLSDFFSCWWEYGHGSTINEEHGISGDVSPNDYVLWQVYFFFQMGEYFFKNFWGYGGEDGYIFD